MPRPRRDATGFTLIEMMVTVAIVGILAAAAAVSISRARPRADLAGVAVDLQSLLHGARQQALATGEDVAVMVFPNYAAHAGVRGRIIVYRDGDRTLLDPTSADKLDDYDPGVPKSAPRSEVVTILDLPVTVRIGPAVGLGTTATLPAPWTAIPVNADCTFCGGAAAARRGAVVFDPRGRAAFYDKAGAPLAVDGGSLSLESAELGQVRTLAVGASTGAVRAVTAG